MYTMRRSFITILLVGVVGLSPSFAFANSTADLRAQIEELMRQALAIREQIRQMAFAQPVQATFTLAGQKQVALQVGHWKMENVPWELRALNPHRQATGGGKME